MVEDGIIGNTDGCKVGSLVDECTGTNSWGHSSDGANVGTVVDSRIGDADGSKVGNGVFRVALRDGE